MYIISILRVYSHLWVLIPQEGVEHCLFGRSFCEIIVKERSWKAQSSNSEYVVCDRVPLCSSYSDIIGTQLLAPYSICVCVCACVRVILHTSQPSQSFHLYSLDTYHSRPGVT